MPSEAARNGDYALPTVFLSVQSDESRHIGNGHSMLMSIINNPENHPLLERDIRYAFWQNHAIVDAAIGTFIEYGTKDRNKNRESYVELWRRWIFDDYYRTYLLPLERYGIKIHHEDVQAAWDRMVKHNYHHHVAQFFSVGWPLNFWRIDPLDERDFEWFEAKYPGWYNEFGAYWENYRKLSKRGNPPIAWADTGYVYPHRCWSCMVPCLIREQFCVDEVDGQLYTYCSEQCRWTHKVAFSGEFQGRKTPAMGRFSGKREWETLYHEWDLADCIKDLGFVRNDNKTLVPQPHLHFDSDKMWTLDDVKGYQVRSPLADIRAMTPQQREKHIPEYRKGFTIHPV
jgi:propane monooxygenase large subunit